jgi:hypothetical protein
VGIFLISHNHQDIGLRGHSYSPHLLSRHRDPNFGFCIRDHLAGWIDGDTLDGPGEAGLIGM